VTAAQVWNLKTMKLKRTITGHGNTICKLVVEGNLLFSGSYTEIKVRTPGGGSNATRY
jgi:hypothetical protein